MSEAKENPTATSWRQSVPQKYRSKEVNEIAKVLASLEPGATPASKLMLASQFENKMFTESATGLADYRKKIQRRLKKIQKNYRKSNPIAAAGGAAGAAGAGAAPHGRKERPSDREVQARKESIARLKRSMLDRHRDKLELIVENGHATTRFITEQHGAEKGERFAQHVDCALQWALDIGAVPDDGTVMKRNGTVVCWGTHWRSLEEELTKLEKIGKDLDSRLKNIWYYVLKGTKIDMFVLERLKEVEEQLMHASSENNAPDKGNAAGSDGSNVATFLAKRMLAIMEKEGIDLTVPLENKIQVVQKQLDKIRSVVPIPRGAMEEKEACLVYLDKIRSACQVLLIYISLDDMDNIDGKNARIELSGSIEKAYNGAIDAFNFLAERYKEVDVRPKGVLLEDAWNKIMEYDKDVSLEEAEVGGSVDESEVDDLDKKRQKITVDAPFSEKKKRIFPLVIQSRVLLRPHRKPPSHLVAALKSKGAEICRDESHAATTLKMQFGNVFEMQIHFSPLLVTIRAIPAKEDQKDRTLESCEGSNNLDKKSIFRETIVDAGLASWKSSLVGLSGPITNTRGHNGHSATPLRVMGIVGDRTTLGPLVAKRLEYASAQATRVLRRCFADVAGKAYDSKTSSDFDVELLEGTAVLKFVTNARSTYTLAPSGAFYNPDTI